MGGARGGPISFGHGRCKYWCDDSPAVCAVSWVSFLVRCLVIVLVVVGPASGMDTLTLCPLSSPFSAVGSGGLAYDSTHNVVLWFGDTYAHCARTHCETIGYNRTFVYNNGRLYGFQVGIWSLVDSREVSPPARTSALISYDPYEKSVLLAGGRCIRDSDSIRNGGDIGVFSDVWIFNGDRWDLRASLAPGQLLGGLLDASVGGMAWVDAFNNTVVLASSGLFELVASGTRQLAYAPQRSLPLVALCSSLTFDHVRNMLVTLCSTTDISSPSLFVELNVSAVVESGGLGEWETNSEISGPPFYDAVVVHAAYSSNLGGVIMLVGKTLLVYNRSGFTRLQAAMPSGEAVSLQDASLSGSGGAVAGDLYVRSSSGFYVASGKDSCDPFYADFGQLFACIALALSSGLTLAGAAVVFRSQVSRFKSASVGSSSGTPQPLLRGSSKVWRSEELNITIRDTILVLMSGCGLLSTVSIGTGLVLYSSTDASWAVSALSSFRSNSGPPLLWFGWCFAVAGLTALVLYGMLLSIDQRFGNVLPDELVDNLDGTDGLLSSTGKMFARELCFLYLRKLFNLFLGLSGSIGCAYAMYLQAVAPVLPTTTESVLVGMALALATVAGPRLCRSRHICAIDGNGSCICAQAQISTATFLANLPPLAALLGVAVPYWIYPWLDTSVVTKPAGLPKGILIPLGVMIVGTSVITECLGWLSLTMSGPLVGFRSFMSRKPIAHGYAASRCGGEWMAEEVYPSLSLACTAFSLAYLCPCLGMLVACMLLLHVLSAWRRWNSSWYQNCSYRPRLGHPLVLVVCVRHLLLLGVFPGGVTALGFVLGADFEKLGYLSLVCVGCSIIFGLLCFMFLRRFGPGVLGGSMIVTADAVSLRGLSLCFGGGWCLTSFK